MDTLAVLDMLIESAPKAAVEHGDWTGKDGLIHCGVCGMRKESIISFSLNGSEHKRKVPVMCRCKEERLASEKRQSNIDSIASRSGMDQYLRKVTFDELVTTKDNEKAIRIAKRYVDVFETMKQNSQGILMYGPPGTGKTFLSACVANALIEQEHTVYMTSFVRLLNAVNAKEDEEGIIRRLKSPELLILDDLGAERGTEYALEKVYGFVDARYRTGKPMILTTNLGINEIKDSGNVRYQRIYDRILQYCYPLQFSGRSWRLREAGRRYNEMSRMLEEE